MTRFSRVLLGYALTAAIARTAEDAVEDAETYVIHAPNAPEPFILKDSLSREQAWKQRSRPKAGHKNGKRARKRR